MDEYTGRSLFAISWRLEIGEWVQEDTDNYVARDREDALDRWWCDDGIPAGAQVTEVRLVKLLT